MELTTGTRHGLANLGVVSEYIHVCELLENEVGENVAFE